MKSTALFYLAGSMTLVALWAAICSSADAGRGGGGNSTQYAVGRSTAPAAPTYVVPSKTEDYAYGSVASTQAELILRVPARAEIWFNGAKATSASGTTRAYATPALDPGWDYSYEVRVRWLEGNSPVEQNRRILVRAGDRMTLNFLDLPAAPR